jgi:hypothetical protein
MGLLPFDEAPPSGGGYIDKDAAGAGV